MTDKMTLRGVGPKFAALSAIYGLAAVIVSRYFDPFFQIEIVPYWILLMLGILLILIGVPFLIIAILTVARAYHADKLVTDGIYKFCRHPLYAAWVVFIVPGIVLLVNSWIGLTTPVFMYFILRILVQEEEASMESVFGLEYLEYKKNVPCIMPVGWIKSLV
ncbi:MAG: isoprenylcysteine carboxylmethyltransferase family protein [Deltaproteobacteria bacterium]|nr:isoprenylcysteine carboxylmethyltransferase family protein [Deltaproteobacteria bacterium]